VLNGADASRRAAELGMRKGMENPKAAEVRRIGRCRIEIGELSRAVLAAEE
jgi:hypothetical protein